MHDSCPGDIMPGFRLALQLRENLGGTDLVTHVRVSSSTMEPPVLWKRNG
jgi:hypothetical protein